MTVPATAAPPGLVRVRLALVTDAGFMPSLKVTAIAWLKGTPVTLLAGLVEVMVGGVVSGAAPVVMLCPVQVKSGAAMRVAGPVSRC